MTISAKLILLSCRSRIFRGLLPTLSGVMATAVFVGIYETFRDVSPHIPCQTEPLHPLPHSSQFPTALTYLPHSCCDSS